MAKISPLSTGYPTHLLVPSQVTKNFKASPSKKILIPEFPRGHSWPVNIGQTKAVLARRRLPVADGLAKTAAPCAVPLVNVIYRRTPLR
jgi:hypothetical protein